MEYIQGATSLDKLISTGNNPFFSEPSNSVKLFMMIVKALSACEKNIPIIFHRDLSPSNILIIPDNSIRIIDFGLCQIAGDNAITLSGEGVGTMNYMAPECESGGVGEVGVHSDLYSAGKILWSAIADQRAFAREKPTFTSKSLNRILPDNPMSWHLLHIFSKTIRYNWQDRWQSSGEAYSGALNVLQLIENRYQPLQILFRNCPMCGFGTMDRFPQSHVVYGNPNPKGFIGVKCNYCGYVMLVDYGLHNEKLKEIESFE